MFFSSTKTKHKTKIKQNIIKQNKTKKKKTKNKQTILFDQTEGGG
jgi:hypothetical protein